MCTHIHSFVQLKLRAGTLEPLPLYIFMVWPNPHPPPTNPQRAPKRKQQHHRKGILHRPRIGIRLGIHRPLGPTVHPVQIPRTARYIFYSRPQKTAHFPPLVPPRDGLVVLLALVRFVVADGIVLCRYELCRTCGHVRVLFLDRDQEQAEVVQGTLCHECTDFTNGGGCYCHGNEFLFLSQAQYEYE